ncbi:MAG: hypothetical protein KBA95_08950 [Acidobacteria bacterium]|nr:hypothetical protein [Acidobacteriota bacterium]
MSRRWIRYGVVLGAAAVVAAAGLGVSAAKPDERVQHLTGAFARAHVAKKEANNQQFRRLRREADARFKAIGVEPTGDVLVVRRETVKKANVIARLVGRFVPTLMAAETWAGGGLEAVFVSYKSGNKTQWLGWTYSEKLSNGWWASADVRIDFGPCLKSATANPYVMWIDGVETERDFSPRERGPLQQLGAMLFPTLHAEEPSCGSRGKRIVRSFIEAGFKRMRADNTYNWMASVFAGAAGGPLGFTISAMGLFGASYATGYLDALWNFTKRCPDWYWNQW